MQQLPGAWLVLGCVGSDSGVATRCSESVIEDDPNRCNPELPQEVQPGCHSVPGIRLAEWQRRLDADEGCSVA